MNQNYGTTGIKHALAMLLVMALEDANHQRLNIPYISSLPTPPDVSVATEASWLRDLLPVVDAKVYEQIRKLLNGSVALPGGLVDRQLFDDTAKNISLILRALSESYHATYAVTANDGLTLWDPGCYPHPSVWRVRETIAALLA
ncbi:MAG: hypothetical protein JWO19_4024 [Bryobacterales bacterium]|jgi:hypothetical protein|nr:hypothetical protein [Bryobacterales bacterium]